MNYIKKRFLEPSTWAGLASVLGGALAASGNPQAAIAAGVVAGLAAVLVPERRGQ